jgi:hypothetical protein
MQIVDIAVSVLLASLNFVLLPLLLRAYSRLAKRFFLVLAIGCLALAFANILTAAIYIYAATQLKVVPISAVEAVYIVQIICGTFGGVLSFIGTVLLVRFALRAHTGVQT